MTVGKAVETTVPSKAGRRATTESAAMIVQYRHPFLVAVWEASFISSAVNAGVEDEGPLESTVEQKR